METFKKTVLVFIATVSILFAQTGQTFNLQIEKSDTKNDSPIIKAQIRLDETNSDGIYISLPAGVTVVVRSASLDGKALWLINSEDKIEKSNVLGWYYKDNGIFIHYTNGFTGLLGLELAPDNARLNKYDQVEIDVHRVKRNNEKLNAENDVVARSSLLIKKNTQADEE